MRAYFALVDDLLTWEEFEAKVGAVCTKEGDEDAEEEAARSVAESLGRLHVKIADLRSGPTLSSFFCKVIDIGDIIRFERDTGAVGRLDPEDDLFVTESPDAEPPGLMRRVLVGDDTGEAVLVFRDMKVHGTQDIRIGDVLEVAVRFKSLSNAAAVDMREAENVDLSLRKSGMKTLKPLNLRVKILSLDGADDEAGAVSENSSNLSGSGRDNPQRHYSEAYVWVIYADACNMNCFARVSVFGDAVAAVLKNAGEGAVVELNGVMQRPSRFVRYFAGAESTAKPCANQCSPDETSSGAFVPADVPAEVSFERLSALPEDFGDIAVCVKIEDAGHVSSYLRPPRSKRRLRGFGSAGCGYDAANAEYEGAGGTDEGIYSSENIFRVRRCIVSDASGGAGADKADAKAEAETTDAYPTHARLVLWGRHAATLLSDGDVVRVYNCNVRYGDNTSSGFEIHAGGNSCVKVVGGDCGNCGRGDEFGEICGIILESAEGLCLIESGSGERYTVKVRDAALESILAQFAGGGDVIVSGRITEHLIRADAVMPVSRDVSGVVKRLENLEDMFGHDNC